MATGPTFPSADTPASAEPERGPDDMLDVVAGLDRQINQLTALKARALVLAHTAHVEHVAPQHAALSISGRSSHPAARFNNAVLAERSFRAEVAALLNISERAAENLIGISKAIVDALPETLRALEDGEISWRHATIMVDETVCMNKGDLVVLEGRILGSEQRLTPPKFARAIRKERELLHPETITARHAAAREQREIGIDDGRDGMATIWATLPAVQAHAIYNRLTTAARAIDDPLDGRTVAQRRADVFTHVMLAEIDGEPFGVIPDRYDDADFVHWFRGVKAEVIVSVPVLTLLGQSDVPATLDGWVPIDPDTAKVLASESSGFTRLLTHPETGVVLSMGRKRYKVSAAMKRFLRIRDLTCRFPGCSIQAANSDIDHNIEWQDGGETNVTNLAHFCRGHHTLKGNTAWKVTQSADGSGVLTFTSPDGRSYKTYPHNPMAA
jgi:hypothetical protein